MTPLRPPTVTRAQAAFINAVGPKGSPIALTVAGRAGTLFWESRVPPLAPVAALDLTFDGMPALVLLDSDPFAGLVELPVAAADLALLPPSLQASLLTQAIDDLLHRVTTFTELSLADAIFVAGGQIAQTPLLSDPGQVELAWRIVGADERTWLRGVLHLSPSLAQRVAEIAAAQRAGQRLAVDELALAPRVEVGRTWLTTAELRALEPDDVVLIKKHRWEEGLVAVIISSNLGYSARVDASELTIVACEEIGLLNDASKEQAAGPGIADIEDVTVPVAFDLGQLELTIGELRRLTEGYILNLQRPLEGAVTLRVNGRQIGRGELVDLEGSLGVRVIEIFPKDHE